MVHVSVRNKFHTANFFAMPEYKQAKAAESTALQEKFVAEIYCSRGQCTWHCHGGGTSSGDALTSAFNRLLGLMIY
jgi:hypothetical protein